MRAVLIALPLLTSAAGAASLGGDYQIEGRNPDGSTYQGTLSMAPAGRAWRLVWDAGAKTGGIGLALDDALVVAIGDGDCALAAYLKNRGGLNGIWTLPGGGAVGTERLRAKADPPQGLAGDYSVFGVSPEGKPYEDELKLEARGDHWLAQWQTERTDAGYGIERGQRLAVTWGAPDCGIAMYRIDADGSLVGIWQLPGSDAIGTETARR